jgi:hypothetical protein
MAQSRSTLAFSGRSKRTQGMPPASHNTARLEMGSNVQKLGSLVRDKLIAVCTQSLLAGVAEERQLLPQRCAAIAEESAAAPAVVPPPQEPVESRLRSTPLAIRGVRAACHMAPPPAPYGVAQGIPHTKRQRGMRGAAIRWGGPRLAAALAAAAHAAALTGHRIPHDMERERERERGCAHVAALAEFESRVGGPLGPQSVRACALVMVVLHGLDRRRIRRRQPDLRSCAVKLVQCSHRSNAKAMHCRTRHALPHLSCCTKPRASTPTSHRRRTLVLNGANRRL